MNLRTLLLALCVSVSAAAIADPNADDAAALRAENARLRAELEALKNGHPDAAALAPAPSPSTAPTDSQGTPPTPEPQRPVAATPVIPPPAATPPPVAPRGYKLVPDEAAKPPSERYSDTGCSRGLFKGPPPAKWLEGNAWRSLRRGDRMDQVEAKLGIEHSDVSARGLVQWQYGRCGDSVGGWVSFVDGEVKSWQAPDF